MRGKLKLREDRLKSDTTVNLIPLQYSHYSYIPNSPFFLYFVRLRLIILTHKCEYEQVIVLPWRSVDDERETKHK